MTSVQVNSIRSSYTVGGTTFPGAAGDGVTDDTAAINHWLAQGGLLWWPAGTYRTTGTLNYVLSGTICFGDGFARTSILADHNLDVVNLTNLRGCTLTGMTIDAPVQRTAGAAVKIKGGDSNYQLFSFGLCLGGHTIDVDMNNQFDHVVFEDNGGIGDWGTVIGNPFRQMTWRNCAPGSNAGIWFNTPHGGAQIVNPVFMASKQMSDTPGPAIRYTASADITLKSVKHIGMGGGLLVDCTANPSPAGDGLIMANDCQFDSTSTGGTFDNVKINLGGGVTGVVFINFGNVWIAGATGNGMHVTGNGTPLLLTWASGTCFSNGGWGLLVDNGAGTAKVRVGQAAGSQPGVLFSSNASGDQHFA